MAYRFSLTPRLLLLAALSLLLMLAVVFLLGVQAGREIGPAVPGAGAGSAASMPVVPASAASAPARRAEAAR